MIRSSNTARSSALRNCLNLPILVSSSSTTIRHDSIVLPTDSCLARENNLGDKTSHADKAPRENTETVFESGSISLSLK